MRNKVGFIPQLILYYINYNTYPPFPDRQPHIYTLVYFFIIYTTYIVHLYIYLYITCNNLIFAIVLHNTEKQY